jgi:hypothetical protein
MGNTWVEMLDQGRSKMTIVMKPEPSTVSNG